MTGRQAAGTPSPILFNYTCDNPERYFRDDVISASDVMKAFLILALSVGIVLANLLLVIVLLSSRHYKFIHSQPRYLLSSLASTNLALGVLVAPVGFYSTLYHCWPFGDVFCSVQAFLWGALSQQNAISLVCLAIDRYFCISSPVKYHRVITKKGCIVIITMTWIVSFGLYLILIVPSHGYYFNNLGFSNCEPFYNTASVAILTACLFYFPPTMALLYCYGSIFHLKSDAFRSRYIPEGTETDTFMENMQDKSENMFFVHDRDVSFSTTRTMAAIGLGFIISVTPWTVKRLVVSCTDSKPPAIVDFLVTWLALSNSLWNVVLYALLNKPFKTTLAELFQDYFWCSDPAKDGSDDLDYEVNMAVQPFPIIREYDSLGEKVWGDRSDHFQHQPLPHTEGESIRLHDSC